MKYLMLFLILIFTSCDDKYKSIKSIKSSDTINVIHYDGRNYHLEETTIEGCDYIVIQMASRVGITHKGNCSNPIHISK